MARHKYGIRPDPRFEEGLFVPSAPVPVPGDPKSWDFIDNIISLRGLSKNPLEASTEISMNQLVVQADVFGTVLTVCSDPDMIRNLFVKKSDNLDLHPIRQAILKPALQDGLITAKGPQWKRSRHLLAPVFTPRHTAVFAETMSKTAKDVIPQTLGDGGDIQLSNAMLSIAYLILSDALFSGDIDENTDDVLSDIADLLAHMGRPNVLDLLGAPQWIPRLNQIIGAGPVKRVRKMISKATARRSAAKVRGEVLPDDFLTLLLDAGDDEQSPLSPAEIEDEMITFIGAGHETTSRAMSWMLYLLSQDEGARTRLEAEVDALDMDGTPSSEWAKALPWGMACFEETMRLFPPAPFISRTIIEADQYEDYPLPAGSALMINLWALHRHRDMWENPDAFNPERFFGTARDKVGRFQYLPFGLGPRVCIGQRFALQEAAILIANLVRHYRFDYIGDAAPWPIMRVTIQADNSMPMRVTRRS